MQTLEDLGHRQRPHPRGRQLDRQRHPIQAPTNLTHRRSVVGFDGEIGSSTAGPVDKQLDRLVGQRQRRHPPAHFTRDADRLTTRGQHGEPRRGTQQRDDQLGARVQQVFAVVQHHQHLAVANEPQQRVHRGAAGLIRQTERTGHRDRDDAGVGDRGQIDVPHAVTELGRDAGRDLNAETGLAGAPSTGQGHQPVVDEQLLHVGHLCAAADKAGELHRKVVGDNGLGGTQRGEVVAQVGVA